jgi:hypothetical protein
MNSILKETQDYILVVGNTVTKENLSYQIVNKKHKVIEIETFLLPQALKHIQELQAALDAISSPEFFKA